MKIELMTTRFLPNEEQNCNIDRAFSQDLCTKVENFLYEQKKKEYFVKVTDKSIKRKKWALQ
jgi:hypothetical protein